MSMSVPGIRRGPVFHFAHWFKTSASGSPYFLIVTERESHPWIDCECIHSPGTTGE